MKIEFIAVCFACLLLRAQTPILKAKLKGIAVQKASSNLYTEFTTRTLVSERQEPGYYSATWDGSDNTGRQVSSGVYFIIFKAKSHKVCKKVLVVK